MKILVDADACPVKEIIVKVAKELHIPVYMFVDMNHYIDDGYSHVVVVDQGRDSVDIALANQTKPGDVAVTQDYGLASMLLGKKAYVIHQNGFPYDETNIERLLFERHLSQKIRRAGGRTSHFRKRSSDDNEKFEIAFHSICTKALALSDDKS